MHIGQNVLAETELRNLAAIPYQIISPANNGPIIGIHMIGSRVGEQIGEAQLIVNWEAFPEEVASLVHAHPTMNEALGEAHLALAGKPLHAHA